MDALKSEFPELNKNFNGLHIKNLVPLFKQSILLPKRDFGFILALKASFYNLDSERGFLLHSVVFLFNRGQQYAV